MHAAASALVSYLHINRFKELFVWLVCRDPQSSIQCDYIPRAIVPEYANSFQLSVILHSSVAESIEEHSAEEHYISGMGGSSWTLRMDIGNRYPLWLNCCSQIYSLRRTGRAQWIHGPTSSYRLCFLRLFSTSHMLLLVCAIVCTNSCSLVTAAANFPLQELSGANRAAQQAAA